MDTTTPRRLGDFEILRELGRGGMGVVYEARQISLNRKVALKVLASGLGLTSRAVERFRREAEAAAKLHHTNIVPVYATGEQDGVPFYAMELINGPSLDQVIRVTRRQAEGMPRATEAAGPAEEEVERLLIKRKGAENQAVAPEVAITGPYGGSGGASSGSGSSSSLGSGGGYFEPWRAWSPRWRTPWTTRTGMESSTATSSRRTCFCRRRGG